jgi:hypothetical protein
MKKIATLILLSQALNFTSTFASEGQLVAWTVASFSRTYISNFDVDQFVENTQISDAMKASLFKKAEGDYSKYLNLKSELTKKYFKKGASQLVYAKLMESTHKSKHGTKRVAFKTTEKSFYNKIEETENNVLKDLLDSRIGIVKSRAKYGEFLISQNYPHKKSESSSDVYWRWYENQKKRIKTEFLLKEVKNYEAYVSLKNQRYYFENPVAIHDFYYDTKKEIEEGLSNKKLNNKELFQLMSKKKKWSLIIDKVNNSQIDHAKTKDIKDDSSLMEIATNSLNSTLNSENKIKSYPLKALTLKKKYSDSLVLETKARDYLNKYIEDKSNNNNYVLSLLFRLASQIELNADLDSISSSLTDSALKATAQLLSELESSNSTLTLEKELDQRLMTTLRYEQLNELEKTVADLIIFTTKFQLKKSSFEHKAPVRVKLKKYGSFEVHDSVRKFLKYEWMQSEYSKFVDQELRWQFDYINIRLDRDTTLRDQEAMNFVLGK